MSRTSTARRSRIDGVVGLIIVVGAGVGGWFGSAVLVDANEPPSSWTDIEVTSQSWDSFTAQNESMLVSHDASTGSTRVEFDAIEDDEREVIEFAGQETWHRVGQSEWQEDDAELLGRTTLSLATPQLVTTVVPPRAEPYTTILPLASEDGLAVFGVTIQSLDFYEADPLSHRRWLTEMLGFDSRSVQFPGIERWVLTVRDDGYIVRWRDTQENDWTWAELAAPLSLESLLGNGSD